jgi:hypothetical protein
VRLHRPALAVTALDLLQERAAGSGRSVSVAHRLVVCGSSAPHSPGRTTGRRQEPETKE